MPISMLSSLSLSLMKEKSYRLTIKSPICTLGHFSLSQHSTPPPLQLIISSEQANDPVRHTEEERDRKKERGEIENEQNEHSMVLIISTCLKQERCAGKTRRITNKSLYLLLWTKDTHCTQVHGPQHKTTQIFTVVSDSIHVLPLCVVDFILNDNSFVHQSTHNNLFFYLFINNQKQKSVFYQSFQTHLDLGSFSQVLTDWHW